MNGKEMRALAERFLDAWNSQEVEAVAATYTDDVVYSDPNTRGVINGGADLRRYLAKLFEAWQMTWSVREIHPLEGGDGCALLWHAEVRRPGGSGAVEFDGMDLVMLRDGRIERNEVNFDRTALVPLMSEER